MEKEEKFTARNKKTGNVAAFGSEESRDKAIEDGGYEEVEKKDDEKKEEPDTSKLSGDDFEVGGGDGYLSKNKKKDDIKSKEKKPKVSMTNTIDRGGDSEVKNLAFEYGFKDIKGKFKPAPGNAGSLLNEVVSGEVAQMIEEDPNLTEEQILDLLYERFGESPLFTAPSKS
jgi:hypothetical protein